MHTGIDINMTLMNKTSITYSGLMSALAVRLLVQRKQGRTSEVAQRPLPVFCPYFTRCRFIRKTDLHPSSTLLMLILISSSTLKSQIKTATEAGQPYEVEMKVNLRDFSVDKKNPSFLLVLLVILFLEQHKLRSTLSFSVTSPSNFLTSNFGLFQ